MIFNFLNSKEMVYHLTSAYYLDASKANTIISSAEYLRGYRPLLARVNLNLAALHAKVPFDMCRVVEKLTDGAQVIYSGIKTYKKSTFQFRLRGEIGPKILKDFTPAGW